VLCDNNCVVDQQICIRITCYKYLTLVMAMIINELLCALKCYYGKHPRSELLTVFSDFYSDTEINDSKNLIYEFADKCSPKIDELVNIKPRVGDGKSRRSMEDIVNIYSYLDVKKIKLPQVLAADCSRIPTLRDFDIGKLSNKIDDMRVLLTSEVTKLGTQFSMGLSDLRIVNDRVLDEVKSSVTMVTADAIASINSTSNEAKSTVSSVCSNAVAALSASTSEIKLVIDKQSNDLTTVSSAVDEIKAATKHTESYAEKIMNSSNSKMSDALPWFTMVNGKPRLIDACAVSTAVSTTDSNRRKVT
jgi:hypothetical protein